MFFIVSLVEAQYRPPFTLYLFFSTLTLRGCDDNHTPSLVAVPSSESSGWSLLWTHLLLPLDHVLSWERLRHLHLPQGQKPQNAGEKCKIFSNNYFKI